MYNLCAWLTEDSGVPSDGSSLLGVGLNLMSAETNQEQAWESPFLSALGYGLDLLSSLFG